jgi:hypothetical protein
LANVDSIDFVAVPEPAAIAVLAIGATASLLRRRRVQS